MPVLAGIALPEWFVIRHCAQLSMRFAQLSLPFDASLSLISMFR